MTKKIIPSLLVGMAVASLIWFSTAENQADEKPTLAQRITQKIESLPNFVDLRVNNATRSDEYGRISAETEPSVHENGVYGLSRADFVVFTEEPLDLLLDSSSYVRLIKPDSNIYDEAQCKAVAVETLRELFEDFLNQGPLPPISTSGPSSSGAYTFLWQRYREDGFPDTRVHLTVRALDGKVIAFGSSKFAGEWQHDVTPAQAKAKATEFVTSKYGFKDVEIKQLRPDGAGGKRFYNIGLGATDTKTGQQLYTSIRLDATTGAITNSIDGWSVVSDPSQKESSLPTDRQPVWTKQGLEFASQRALTGMPVWAPSREQLFLRDMKGQISAITSDLSEGSFAFVNASSSGDSMVFSWHGWGYALNLSNGSYRVLSTPDRFLVTPTVRPDGKWAVVAGKAATGSSGLDLTLDALERTPEMALRGRLLIPESDEFLPTFSPDGKWLYFLKSTKEKQNQILSLHRISATLIETKERLNIKAEQQQTLVEKLPFSIGRLSISPNGRYLVAQVPDEYIYRQEDPKKPAERIKVPSRIVSIDTNTREIRDLKLPELRDAEIGNFPIQDINDAWAGPGNDEVTFSGKTVDADKKERRRIYSCRFDGSNLRAWTPAENTPVPAYQFPQGEKTAYKLAKEMALGEIQWDDAHREK